MLLTHKYEEETKSMQEGAIMAGGCGGKKKRK